MKFSNAILLSLSAVAVSSALFTLNAEEHDGHDHSGHSHDHKSAKASADESSSNGAFVVTEEEQSELGVETAEVPSRVFGDNAVELTALPKGSVFREDGKHFVLALSDSKSDSFEKWEVTLGASDQFFVEAKTGVFPGDRIVIAGVDSLRQLASNKAVTTAGKQIAETTTGKVAAEVEEIESSETRPLQRHGACTIKVRFRPNEHAPRCPAGIRECDVTEIEGYHDPHFHGHFDHHHHGYGHHGW